MEAPETIFEERESTMVSPRGRTPFQKVAHFIKPILGLADETPDKPFIFLPFRPVVPKVTFNGWRNPTQEWISWVDRLHSSYQYIWKSAGIYEAILSSRYKIIRNDDLFFSLAERWCSGTNTFVFSWGEATITLEDITILGGYSVLGDSVYVSDGDKKLADIEKKLKSAYQEISRGNPPRAKQSSWMKHFVRGDSRIEHEAFLSLWLSRFVLPTYPFDVIVQRFFKISIYLARGTKIALAPVVLASIYRDLSLLKSAMTSDNQVRKFDKGHAFDDLVMVTVWAPLQLVQVWAWERFPEFRPNPRAIEYGEPRLARWHAVERVEMGNVRSMLQSAADTFDLRPYCKQVANLPLPSFYRENEERVVVNSGLDEDLQALSRFLKVCELVGVDSFEQYNPHRVAMQFGFDLDIPIHVTRWMLEPDTTKVEQRLLAWSSFTKPIQDHIMYVPSRNNEPHVTVRLLKWHREGVLARGAAFNGIVQKKRSSKKTRKLQEIEKAKIFADNEADVPPGFTLKSIFYHHVDVPCCFLPKNVCNDSDVPPGFLPKPNVVVTSNVAKEDESGPFRILKHTSKIKEEGVEPLLMSVYLRSNTFPADIDPNGESKSGTQEGVTSVKSEPIILGFEEESKNANEEAPQTVVHGTEGETKPIILGFGRSENANEEEPQSVVHGAEGETNRYPYDSVALDITDHINRVKKVFEALKDANLARVSSPL